VLWTTAAGRDFFAFAQESAAETRKVVCPTRNETLQATAIVFVFVLIMALFMWVVDGILLWIVKKLIGGE
jgi:preprotein translocase subunit SecE